MNTLSGIKVEEMRRTMEAVKADHTRMERELAAAGNNGSKPSTNFVWDTTVDTGQDTQLP